MTTSAPQLDITQRTILEMLHGALVPAVDSARDVDESLHCQLRSTVVELSRVLGKEPPIKSREVRLRERQRLQKA